jgi:outer membrane protein OmpA-like peptidoglycan-associated protein
LNTIRQIIPSIIVVGASGVIACASAQPPPELVQARMAYHRASVGPAQQYNPSDIDAAKRQLDEAETCFKEDGDAQVTRDAAYVALRKAELAEVVGRAREAKAGERGGQRAMGDDERQSVARTSAELGRARSELATQAEILEGEREDRKEVEERVRQAAEDLAKFATVEHQARGMVITLSGNELFASGKAELKQEAQTKLDEVAKTLGEEDPNSRIVVEGHTDRQGSDENNQRLSHERAQVVREYLASRDIANDRISARGFGPTRPLTDDSAEGAGDDGRIEIVVLPARR